MMPSSFRRLAARASLAATLAAGLILGLGAGPAAAERLIVQSTTSTQNSGLLDAILPAFEAESGIDVQVVAVGTGQAIANARAGDGDVLLVHSRPDEALFVAQGWGVERLDVMYNDFVLVGPAEDPAGVRGYRDAAGALRKIAVAGVPFVSRGDESGTHKAEMRLWEKTGVDVAKASGTWYRETGSGMGATLNTARGMNAYALTDRATWIAFGNKGSHEILSEGDPKLFNQYGVIAVNPERHPHVAAEAAERFIAWLTGPEGQAAIAGYRMEGQQLFFPNAK